MNKKELNETQLNKITGGMDVRISNPIKRIERERIQRLTKKYEKMGMSYTEEDGMFQLSKDF